MKKKIGLFISVLLMAIGIGSGWSGAGTVEASSTYISGDFEYELNDGKATIVGYSGQDTNVVLPETVDGYKVTQIGANAFSGTRIGNIDIPENIIAIGDGAFCYTGIKSITIPDTVTEIGFGLFENCPSLTKVKLPSGLTTIPMGTFSQCTSLVDVTLPDKVSVIEDYAFGLCENLEKIVIPNSVKTIGEGAFNECKKLKNITIPSSVTSIEWMAFENVPLVHNLSSAKENDWGAKVIHKESASTCTICNYVCKHTSKTTKVTAATTSKDGAISSICNECKKTVSTKPIYKASNVKLSTATYTYNGKTKSPTVTVKDSKGNTISSKYYTLSKPSGRKNVGKYTYKIKFKGNYSGTKSLTLTINPKATKIKTPSKAKKAFTAKWTKVSSQVTGYQIMYSTNSKFKSGNKTVTVNKYKTTSKKISKLKAKKTYYVKVRTYKTVKVNGKSTKLYSAWSSVKKVKTK